MNVIKLSETELNQIKGFQQSFASITIQSGKVTLALQEAKKELKRLESINENILSDYEKLTQDELNFTKELETRYGKGVINLAEGTFTSQDTNTNSTPSNNLQERIVSTTNQ